MKNFFLQRGCTYADPIRNKWRGKTLITRRFQAKKKKLFVYFLKKVSNSKCGYQKVFCQTPTKFANWLVREISEKRFCLSDIHPVPRWLLLEGLYWTLTIEYPLPNGDTTPRPPEKERASKRRWKRRGRNYIRKNGRRRYKTASPYRAWYWISGAYLKVR